MGLLTTVSWCFAFGAFMLSMSLASDCDTIIRTPSARITSPGFPRNYPDDVVCVTKLRSDVISSFLVRFVNFSVEEDSVCEFDSVKIYPVTGEPPSLERAAEPLRVLCGTLEPDQMDVSWQGLGLDVVFSSDDEVTEMGFEADVLISPLPDDALLVSLKWSTLKAPVNSTVTLECYGYKAGNASATVPIANITWTRDNAIMEDIHDSVIKVTSGVVADVTFSCFGVDSSGQNGTAAGVTIEFKEDCDKTIRTPSARITSPGFPGHYPNDVECVTRLRSDVISTLLVRFLSFTLEGGYDCDSDSVKIYPVTGEQSSLERAAEPLRVLCGRLESGEMEVSWEGLGLDIVFSSDHGITRSGFEAEVLISPLDDDVLSVSLIARTFRETTPVNSIVTLECQALDPGDVSATVPIANITWTRDNTIIEDIHDSVIDVTSDVTADVTFSCFVTDVNGRNGTDDVVVAFKREELSVSLITSTRETTVNSIVTLECFGHRPGNVSATVPIANSTWRRDNTIMEGIHDTVINVTSDIPAFPSFRCFVTDVYGRDGTGDVVIAFKEDCNRTISTPSARITSPRFPSPYPPNALCVTRLRSDVISLYQVRILSLTLETEEGRCRLDSVEMYPVTGDPTSLERVARPLYVLCGRYESQMELTYEGLGLDIVFTSDESVNLAGFEAEVLITRLDAFLVSMITSTSKATINSIVTLECFGHRPGDVSSTVPIANITWTRDNKTMEDIHDRVINVTSEVAADVTFSCFVTDVNGRNGTEDVVIEFVTLWVSLIASTFETTANSIVTLECQALDPGNPDATIIPIANITWTRDNTTMEDIHDSVINVTSDVAADVTFSCFVTGVNGRNGTDDVVIKFKEDCDTTIRTATARITSPGFPNNYPLDTVCVTKLRSDVLSSYQVRFLNFTLERSSECLWDSVTIYPVTGEPSSLERRRPPLRVLCGTLWPFQREVSWVGLGLDIVFSSDKLVNQAGFEAEVLISPLDNDCDTTIRTPSARITSPGFPSNYPNDQVCVTRLRSNVTSTFLVRFVSLSLEDHDDCDYDSVKIYAVTGESSPLERVEGPLRVLCGDLYPEYNEMEVSWEGLGLDIVFNSDHSQNYKGFEAEVIISPLDEDTLSVSLTASTFESTVNSIVTLKCQALDPSNPGATIIPTANITWTRDNTAMEDIHDSVINVTSEVAADVTFSCFVTDVNGRNGTDDVVIAFEKDCNCNQTIRTPSTRITSPRFPRNYPNNNLCVTKLRSDVISSFLVRFVSFTLEDDSSCDFDSVKIYPVAGEPSSLERAAEPLRVLCGTLEADQKEVNWEGLGLDIVFSSDETENEAGFEAEVFISPPDDGHFMDTGLELTLSRNMIFRGDDDHFGTLTCQANGNDVTVESVVLTRIKVTGESTDLLTVTRNRTGSTSTLDGMLGNGTFQNNSGYIFMDQVEAAVCDSSYFLCETTYTTQSGERKRAVAITRPGQPESGHSGQHMPNRPEPLAVAEKKLSDLSAAFEMLNGSYASLLEDQQKVAEANANISAKISELENKLSSIINQRQAFGPCSNITTNVEELQRRLEVLENSTDDTQV